MKFKRINFYRVRSRFHRDDPIYGIEDMLRYDVAFIVPGVALRRVAG